VLDRQLHADDAVGTHCLRFFAHAGHGELTRLVHRCGEHGQLLVLVPAPVLYADVVDARPDAEADRFEPGLADQQKFVDRKIGGEDRRRRAVRTGALRDAFGREGGDDDVGLLEHDQMAPSLSYAS
jgi:hypothetical protein